VGDKPHLEAEGWMDSWLKKELERGMTGEQIQDSVMLASKEWREWSDV